MYSTWLKIEDGFHLALGIYANNSRILEFHIVVAKVYTLLKQYISYWINRDNNKITCLQPTAAMWHFDSEDFIRTHITLKKTQARLRVKVWLIMRLHSRNVALISYTLKPELIQGTDRVTALKDRVCHILSRRKSED